MYCIYTGVCLSQAPSLTGEEEKLLTVVQILVEAAVSNHKLRDDVPALLDKTSLDRTTGHARIAIKTLSLAASLWHAVDHGTVLTLLFHCR